MTDGPACAWCGRALRTPASQARGYGPICAINLGLAPPRKPRRRPADTDPATQPIPGQMAIPIQLTIT